jgi:hypothetical protein
MQRINAAIGGSSTDMAQTPSRSRTRQYVVLLLAVLLMVGGWIGFWKYAANAAQENLENWRAREAKAGRVVGCNSQEIGGFPFRFELKCDGASAVLGGGQIPVELKAANVHIAAQVYQPTLLISEFTGPLTIGDPGRPPAYTANWKLAQSSVSGLPEAPRRVSLVVSEPVITRAEPAGQVARADHIEVHGRLAEGSVSDRPVIEFAFEAKRFETAEGGPLLATTTDGSIDAVLRGLHDFSPKPWPARFREIQQAGGRIEIRKVRLQQGDTIAVGAGNLGISPEGRVEGQLNLTVAGLDAFINRMAAASGQRVSVSISLGLGLLAGSKQVEGKPAIAIPLKVTNGAMMLGPLKIGEIPPLF